MHNRSQWMERRRAYRVQPPNGVAQCTSKEKSGIYSIYDLSRSGVALDGGMPMPSGAKVDVRLMIPGYEVMELRGTVLRTTQGPRRSSRVAVGLARLDADDEDRIGNVIVGELARGTAPRCMIASGSERERRVLAARLASLGVQVIQAGTPMEVIHRLETARRPIDSIIIGGSVGDCDGVEFASFVAGAYPKVRRVLSAHCTGRRAELARHVAHASLEGRWGADDLRLAVLAQNGIGGRG